MPTFDVYALVEGCFVQEPLQLSSEIEAETVGTLACMSQVEFMNEFTKRITGGKGTFIPDEKTLQSLESAEPVLALKRIDVDAESYEDAEANVSTELHQALRLLSLITGNAGRVFAVLVTSAADSWGRIIPAQLRTRFRLGFGNIGPGYEALVRDHFQKALSHPRLALLYSLLYEANAELNDEFKFLKFYTLLDVASAHLTVTQVPPGGSEAAERIKALFQLMNVSLSMQPIDPHWTHQEGIVDITRQVRNRVAHDGKFEPSDPRVPPYCRDAVNKLPQVLVQIRSYSEIAVSFLANTLFM